MIQRQLIATVCALVLTATAATAQQTATQPIEFVRGCWVGEYNKAKLFLRLLPSPPDAPDLKGSVMIVDGDTPKTGLGFSFRRDGSAMTVDLGPPRGAGTLTYAPLPARLQAQAPPASVHRASFRGAAGTDWAASLIMVHAEEERLAIVVMDSEGGNINYLVDMVRDGCD